MPDKAGAECSDLRDGVKEPPIDQHKLRLAIPPGITGLQQVHCRGSNSMDEVLKYDLQYISEQSFWLDLYIFTRTVSTLLLGKGTP
ncbi:MAG TPA: sugar transferase [Acidobacteriota bacterium]